MKRNAKESDVRGLVGADGSTVVYCLERMSPSVNLSTCYLQLEKDKQVSGSLNSVGEVCFIENPYSVITELMKIQILNLFVIFEGLSLRKPVVNSPDDE
jgi:hypothetical protein